MSEKRPVIVYGVSGYTGRLVCEYLREYNIPFIAAGRDAAKVKAVVEKLPGIETADYEVAEVEHTVEALTKLFRGTQVVSNMVGPFIKYGPEVVEACLAAGCHYTDTTGEQDWVLLAQERWGAKFAAHELLLAPNVAQMYTTGEIAAKTGRTAQACRASACCNPGARRRPTCGCSTSGWHCPGCSARPATCRRRRTPCN